MDKLPLRLRVLQQIGQNEDGYNIATIMDVLKEEYGMERQFNEATFLDHLLSLNENGLTDESSVTVDNNQELRVNYVINEEGQTALAKYLPKTKR